MGGRVLAVDVVGVVGRDHRDREVLTELEQPVSDVAALFHGRQILHLVGDTAVLDLAIGRLDEAVFVHPRNKWRAN